MPNSSHCFFETQKRISIHRTLILLDQACNNSTLDWYPEFHTKKAPVFRRELQFGSIILHFSRRKRGNLISETERVSWANNRF
jgi:hypothetical protein